MMFDSQDNVCKNMQSPVESILAPRQGENGETEFVFITVAFTELLNTISITSITSSVCCDIKAVILK